MRIKAVNLLKYFIGWPLSVVAIIFIFKIIAPQSKMLFENLKNSNFFILSIGILCFVLYFFIRSYIWNRILYSKGYNLKLKQSSFLWGISEIKRYIPGNIWSFLGRAHLFSKEKVSKKDMFSSFFIEAQLVVLSSALISILSLPLIIDALPLDYSLKKYLTVAVLIITVTTSFVYIFNSRFVKKINFRYKNLLRYFLPDFDANTNFSLFVIYAFAFLLFGAGNYFVVASATFLSPKSIPEYIGIFVFSLLGGYLSLLTPTGLGVREGISTFYLAKFMATETAGFMSIYSRIVLTLSEILFLTLSYLWKNAKSNFFLKIENLIAGNKHLFLLFIMFAVYTSYFTIITFLKHDNFYTGRFDLGNMDQTIWNTLHGRIFQLTDPNGTDIISRLSFHADFLLILLSPFYLIWSSPKMLLFLQTTILGSGAIFVYLLSEKIIKNKTVSLSLAFAYLLNPSLQYSNLFDFHAVTLSTAFLLGAFYFLINKRYFYFTLFSLLAAISKEQVWLITSLFGLYISADCLTKMIRAKVSGMKILREKRLIFGFFVFLFSIAAFYFLMFKAIPASRGTQHFALSYYSEFGDSPGNIIKNIIFAPQKTVSTVLQKDRTSYLREILGPVGYLPLLSPVFLIFTLPDLTINLLSNNSQLHQIYFQYTATITPFLFISSIFGLNVLKKRFPKIPISLLSSYIILASLYSSYYFGPLPGAKNPNIDAFIKEQPGKAAIENFLSGIPKRYSIAATNNIGSHISHRHSIYTIPVGVDKADIVIFLLNDPFAQPSLKAQKEMAQKLKKDVNYQLLIEKEDFIAFKKKGLNIKFRKNF